MLNILFNLITSCVPTSSSIGQLISTYKVFQSESNHRIGDFLFVDCIINFLVAVHLFFGSTRWGYSLKIEPIPILLSLLDGFSICIDIGAKYVKLSLPSFSVSYSITRLASFVSVSNIPTG